MDNRHYAMDKAWTARGQHSCPHPAHTLPTAPYAAGYPQAPQPLLRRMP